ncbi:MAG: DinB family protein [Ardenticatenaceae bacterium]|nr:DinB family protein [Ardenticatenaceae bacterium]MCB9443836.1 DinB family protein [Ardenticatenaceae bacterium]
MIQADDIQDLETQKSRKALLACLAGERANLLRQLRGIDESVLCSVPVSDRWTVRDILVHLGSWDAFHSERMSMILNGRINAIRELGEEDAVDARNAEILTFSRNLTLEPALALCLKERSGFLATLARIPDELLHREIELPWGWRTQMIQWTEWRYQHDAGHATELNAWRNQLDQVQTRQIGPVFLLRAILKATRKEFLALADLIDEDERTTRPVCGVWTLKDLVGHLTDWERVGVAGLRQLVAGETPEFDELITDFDTWNDAHAAVRHNQPWDEVWADFMQTRGEFLALVDQMGEADWQRPFTAPWDSQINGYFWVNVWAGHDHEHAADVRNALGL